MKLSFSVFLILMMFLRPMTSLAFETDQYNLPPEPLADVGVEVLEYVEEDLRLSVQSVNKDIERSLACLQRRAPDDFDCGSNDSEFAKLLFLRSGNGVAAELFDRLAGDSIMFTKFGKWMNSHDFRGQPARYKASYSETIYVLNPTDYFTLSPTVKLYGSEFGVDKLEHFFQQGYKYFQIEKKAFSSGDTQKLAELKAIRWGQRTERTYYGLLTSGVYSNADLFANYVGMKFFQGLTKPLQINGIDRPATLRMVNGLWQINPNGLGDNFLKPFMTDHMNEALNPSSFRFTLVRSVRREVKKHACPKWHRAYPDLTAEAINARLKKLQSWNGENYGYTPMNGFVTIAETCF